MADASTQTLSRGWQGRVLKLLGADDFVFTVTSNESITDDYVRLGFTGGGLLASRPIHPTMWVRLWFEDNGKLHQRGYTLVDTDLAADTFYIEFAIHDGTAARWAQAAEPGDQINATFMGSKFAYPEPAPSGWLIVGDSAALPAINSLLEAIDGSSNPAAAATIWFEVSHASERTLPMKTRAQDTVHYVDRTDGGADLIAAVTAQAFDATGQFGWVATESVSTRAITAVLRNDYKLGRKGVKSQAYWIYGRSFG
ncbi:hypothetical protein GOEFS_036_00580 [Gordonia effusa NBRC 100432]|uniref:FAD-binding FR-type domain-containing protein n=1 Tax=Gordonia effusa NBRC 100432 TaxID=1077974 RepID=H0QXR8_9ACTN|nr:siderophore-interacting protein [Gordonia effusa]GAB17619.1 hypothetical protein GOEFS_036_00580 [Gordonia effusa NBRC 100432]